MATSQETGAIRVLLADDHALLRQGLRRILELESDLVVVGEAGDAEEAVAKVAELEPHVVLMDITMPRGGGVEATRTIVRQFPDVHVIALTIHDDDEYVVELINAGARGYLLKDVDPARVVEAIRRVARGESFIPPTLMSKVLGEFRRLASLNRSGRPSQARGEVLTEREQEILQLIVDGHTNREIAAKLFISEKTVKNHITNILKKLQLSDRTQAAVYAIRHGLVAQ
ncbi:MAG TPA: response regulator transcription factor [Limnochordia bacterium]